MKNIVPTAIAISFGVLVLLGFIFPIEQFILIRGLLTDWAVIVAALAILLGILNLILSNWERIRNREQAWFYNLITILSLIGILLIDPISNGRTDGSFYSSTGMLPPIFTGIITATQASLAGIAVVFLISGAAELYRKRKDNWSILFLSSVIFVLLTWVPLTAFKAFSGLRDWFLAIPVAAGLRGIIIGGALGILFFGIRTLVGAERLYEEKEER